jgi:hypothetical protein
VSDIDHPPHYTGHPSGVECIQITEHMGFNLGNAVKYIWRAGLKDPANPLKDLDKAIWYLEREKFRLEQQAERLKKAVEHGTRANPPLVIHRPAGQGKGGTEPGANAG